MPAAPAGPVSAPEASDAQAPGPEVLDARASALEAWADRQAVLDSAPAQARVAPEVPPAESAFCQALERAAQPAASAFDRAQAPEGPASAPAVLAWMEFRPPRATTTRARSEAISTTGVFTARIGTPQIPGPGGRRPGEQAPPGGRPIGTPSASG